METGLPPNLKVSSVLPADFGDYRIDGAGAMQALSAAEDAHFWHRSRNALITSRLQALGTPAGAEVVELGCGGGAVAAALSTAGYKVVGVDGHVPRLREAARRAPQAEFWAHDLSKGPPPVPQAHFAVVALFDVIEHLDHPAAALADAMRLLAPGGLLVGTVPALMALWSPIDEASGHKRRYSRATLGEILGGVAGARLVEIRDFNRHLVPLTWLQRRKLPRGGDSDRMLAENLQVPSKPVNAVFLGVAAVERMLSPVLELTRLPGASLWFALRKDGTLPGPH